MTATPTPTILSGHCGIRRHPQCLGVYGGYDCRCECHTAPEPEPEPEPPGLRIGSLFSGYGGLERGVQAVLGGTVAWHSDIDPGACKILAHRYPDVPNLGDITAVDWSAVEPVDVLTGGFAVAADAHLDGREVVERVEPGLGTRRDSDRRSQVDWGAYTAAVRRWERLTRPAPAPTEPGAKGQPRLSPAFVEWMQGLPAGWVTDVPGLSRNEQLKALGNGVVPQQAEAALRLLLANQMEEAA